MRNRGGSTKGRESHSHEFGGVMGTRVLHLNQADWISTDDAEGFISNPSNEYFYYFESETKPADDVGHALPYLRDVNFKISPPNKLWLKPVGKSATVVITTR